jgi:phenylacetate-CoA ligase
MTTLPRYLVLDSRIERLPRGTLSAMQSDRLRTMARYVCDNTPFWRRKFDAAGVRPEDISGLEDLPRIPFCTKTELLEDQQRHPPFGSYVASHPTHWHKLFATSGTTGPPLLRVYSHNDWSKVLDRFQRSSPAEPGDRIMILGPTDGLLGPTAGAEGLARRGAMVILAGRYDTRGKIDLIRRVRPTVVLGAASYLLHMAEVAREMGVDLTACGVKVLMSVGEPGAAVAATRRRLEQGWAAAVSDGFGLTEIFPLGGSCPQSAALHLPDDLVITEIVDPATGTPLPPEQPGEVVFTNLVGDTQPLLRFRTRDIARAAPPEPCACGFTGTRLVNSIEGRVDDMIWYKGLNVFPTAIEAVLRGFRETGNEFQIVVSGGSADPSLTVKVEVKPDAAAGADLAARLRQAIKSAVGINVEIELTPDGSMPRADAKSKARRVVDLRHRPA